MAGPDPRNPFHLVAFGFGAGFFPRAPGTVGTLVGVVFFLMMASLPLPLYAGLVAALFVAGIGLCERVSRDLGVHDHRGIVWDEIVGYLVTMTAAPADGLAVAAGFALFRLFDVLKPWPIRALDRRVGGGVGIMLDDLVAGIFAAAVLQLLLRTGLL